MNSKPVVALAQVSEDVQLAHDYFAARLDAGGDKFLKRYFTATDQIALNPWSFPLKFDDYHRALDPQERLCPPLLSGAGPLGDCRGRQRPPSSPVTQGLRAGSA